MDTVAPRVPFLGLLFDDLEPGEVVAGILRRPMDAPFAYVVTPNADHLARLRRQPALRGLYEAAWLRLLDSALLGNVARLLSLPCPAVSPGADLTALLLPHLAGETATIIGLDAAAFAALRARFPGVVWRHHAPPQKLAHKPEAFAAAVEFAVADAARIVFLAVGSPLQERLAAAIAARPAARGTGLCVGAALLFAAGARRAPIWMRRAGLEWLYRLGGDPRRLARRYLLDDPPILAALLREAARRKTTRA